MKIEGHMLMRVIAIVLVVLCWASPAAGQDRIGDQLALARIGASECGLTCTDDELAAIALALHTRAARMGMRFEAFARVYSAEVFNTARRDQRAWIAHLRADGREPAHWPAFVTRRGTVWLHLPWRAARSRWLSLYERAGRVVRGEVAARCDGIEHWGMSDPASADYQRAIRAGWERIDCGDTRNAFWRVPREELGG